MPGDDIIYRKLQKHHDVISLHFDKTENGTSIWAREITGVAMRSFLCYFSGDDCIHTTVVQCKVVNAKVSQFAYRILIV